jgi:hypothetical protein
MLNKRKAMLGWLVYTAAKPFVKRALKSKSKAAVPGTREGSRAPNTAAVLAVVAAAAGALMFWRNRQSDDEIEPSES